MLALSQQNRRGASDVVCVIKKAKVVWNASYALDDDQLTMIKESSSTSAKDVLLGKVHDGLCHLKLIDAET